jgi:hypothetical protein
MLAALRMKRRSLNVRLTVPLALALGAAACTKNPYVIGSVCPVGDAGVDADPRCVTTTMPPDGGTMSPEGGSFAVDLDHSGASFLGPLALAGGPVQPTLWLRGERATATGWPTEAGAALGRGTGTPAPGLEAPFTDGTSAVGLPADAPAYRAADATLGAVGADDFALEIVLRATAGASVLDRRSGATGWSLHANAGGQLALGIGDGDAAHAVEIASAPLTAGAWYHCLFWVSRAGGGRADCDGRAGTLTVLPALGALDAPTAMLAAGGGAAVRIAHLAIYRVAAGGLGDPGTWLALARRRFVTLAGAYPRVWGGTASPAAGLRDSEAYLDLQVAAGAPRRLFLVGADWPRIACRTDVTGMHDCGYLSEPRRTRLAPADASAWQPSAVAVAPSAVPFADGEPRMEALVPSAASTTHALSFTGTLGAARQVFSFFVHRAGAARVGAGAGTVGTAVFDLAAGSVISSPMGAQATIEAWGDDIFRCTYAFVAPNGPTTYSVRLLDDAGSETFAGSGGAAVEVAGLQVDVGLAFAGSLFGADAQAADRLTFRADDGNLPAGSSTAVTLRVMVPAGARLTDQAILNLNHAGAFDDQVQLFVRGDVGRVGFWGLSPAATHWTFDGVPSVIDGARHRLSAGWDAATARLVIDGMSATMPVMPNAAPFGLDRIDVGFSESSGALEGLVAGLQIGAM